MSDEIKINNLKSPSASKKQNRTRPTTKIARWKERLMLDFKTLFGTAR